MKLQKIVEMGKYDSLVYLENFVNQGSPSGFSRQNDILGEFAPGRMQPVEVLLMKPNYPVLEYFTQRQLINSNIDSGVLAIHPMVIDLLKDYEKITDLDVVKKVNAYVTASGRTLLAQIDDKFSFLKLHFPQILGRVYRHLPLRKAIAGVEISNIVVEHIVRGHIKDIGILPEIKCCGIVRKGLDDSISFIERATEVVVNKGLDNGSILIPGFSLFSGDIRNTEDKLLIQQICEEFRIVSPIDFYERIVHPLLAGYLKLTFEYGLMPEINAQNLLYAVDLNKQLIYPVLRDMGRVEKLLYINHDLDSLISCPYKTIYKGQDDYATKRHSFSFDFKLTQYVLEPIVDGFCKMERGSDAMIKQEIYSYASETIDTFTNARLWLPKSRKAIGHPKMLLTEERPYIEMGDPVIR